MENWPLDLASGSCLDDTDKDNFLGGARARVWRQWIWERKGGGLETVRAHCLFKASLCKEGQREGATVWEGVEVLAGFLGWEKLLMFVCGQRWFRRAGQTDDPRETREETAASLGVFIRNAKIFRFQGAGSRRFDSEKRGRLRDIWNFLSMDACVSGAQLLNLNISFFDVVRIPEPTMCSQEYLIK